MTNMYNMKDINNYSTSKLYNLVSQNAKLQNQNSGASSSSKNISADFASILNQKLNGVEGLRFSKHAETRLFERKIVLSESQKQKIAEAVKKAEQKGVKESLILMDSIAFVVNIKNRTVITAADSRELKDNVFTNIDGAVVI